MFTGMNEAIVTFFAECDKFVKRQKIRERELASIKKKSQKGNK